MPQIASHEQEVRSQKSGVSFRRARSVSFTNLVAWQKAHKFVLAVYKFTKQFPTEEKYGLTSQLRRAAVSIPANLAEGFRKKSSADKKRFFNIAQGSLEECRYYLILSKDLGYGTNEAMNSLLAESSKLIDAYMKKIGE